MKEGALHKIRDYDDLSSIISPFRTPDLKMSSIDSISKLWHIDPEDTRMIYKLIKVEDKIDVDLKKSLHGLIEKETAVDLVECLNYFGVKVEDSENFVRYLEWDATGVYGEHSSYTVLYKKGSYHCSVCKKQVPDFERMCESCKTKDFVERFDPII